MRFHYLFQVVGSVAIGIGAVVMVSQDRALGAVLFAFAVFGFAYVGFQLWWYGRDSWRK